MITPIYPTIHCQTVSPSSIDEARGVFKDGHTSEDVAATLPLISEFLGMDVVMTWDYLDCWGCGGNSQMMVRDQDGKFYDAPEKLRTYLYDEGNDVDLGEVKVEGMSARGNLCEGNWLEAEHPHNYTETIYEGEAPKM